MTPLAWLGAYLLLPLAAGLVAAYLTKDDQ